MDGTIYLSEQLFDGTIDFLNYVKRIGGRYLFLTNNSSRGTDAYIAKMKRLGIEAFPEDFLTSADAAVHSGGNTTHHQFFPSPSPRMTRRDS